MTSNVNKLLLALDGSKECLSVVRYVSQILSPAITELTLFHVMSRIPEVFWDLQKDPAWLEKVEKVKNYEKKQEAAMLRFMDDCRNILISKGFHADSVNPLVRKQRDGIARDIVAEARKGYDALVIGRGKTGSRKDMPLGGVASKILSASLQQSVWLVGNIDAPPANVLIALDSSENSIRAVKHAGKMLRNGKSRVTLFHTIRELSMSIDDVDELFPESFRQQHIEEAEREFLSAEKLARLWLGKNDILADRVHTRIATGEKSRAGAVIKEAEAGGYGTIVVGKKGISEVMDFAMGRVTNKLTQIAKAHALWIVS